MLKGTNIEIIVLKLGIEVIIRYFSNSKWNAFSRMKQQESPLVFFILLKFLLSSFVLAHEFNKLQASWKLFAKFIFIYIFK